MRILHLIPHFLPSPNFGGTPIVCDALCRELVHLGHDVTVATTDAFGPNLRSPATFSPPYHLQRFPNLFNSIAYRFKMSTPVGFMSFLRTHLNDFDIVHLHEYRSNLNLVAGLVAASHPRFFLQPHGTFANYNTRLTAKSIYDFCFSARILSRVSALIAVSLSEQQLLTASLPHLPVHLLPNGITPPPPPRPMPVPERFILYLGRIDRRKGIDYLIRAYAGSSLGSENIHLVIAGNDDGFLTVCQHLVSSLHLNHLVHFPGAVGGQERTFLFQHALFLAYVATEEAFGLVPLEAAASGLFSVVSVDSGVTPWLTKFRAVYPVEYGNIAQLTAGLEKFSRSRFAIRLPSRIQDQIRLRFGWEKITRELVKIYLTP